MELCAKSSKCKEAVFLSSTFIQGLFFQSVGGVKLLRSLVQPMDFFGNNFLYDSHGRTRFTSSKELHWRRLIWCSGLVCLPRVRHTPLYHESHPWRNCT